MVEPPENPPKKPWSASDYRSRKAERDRQGNESQPSDQPEKKSDGWDEFLNSPEIRKFAEEEARKQQMVSNAFRQATNPPTPKAADSPQETSEHGAQPGHDKNPLLHRWDTNTLSAVPWDGSVTIRDDDAKPQGSPRVGASSNVPHWFDQGIWANPLFLGILVMVAFAISFSPKASTVATWFCLFVAWMLATRLIHTRTQRLSRRWLSTVLLSGVSAVVFAAFGWWLVLPIKASLSQSAQTETIKSGSQAPKADWKTSEEAKQLSSQILNDIQGMIDEGRVIDVSDYQRGAKAYAAWAEKCSVILGRVDNRMRRFGQDTDYKTRFDKASNTRRTISPGKAEEFDRDILKSDIRLSLIELDTIKKNVVIGTKPDSELLRMPL